jgi:hypothetical protein
MSFTPEVDEAPTHLSKWENLDLIVSTDKLSAKFTGTYRSTVGAIQANKPAPHQRLLYYFEISVKDRREEGRISIGFTDEYFDLSQQPGWEQNSIGYHGDDGNLYNEAGWEDFGPKFSEGDTVGAGINYTAQELFFTKNGKLVGTTPLDLDFTGPLYPTIGLHSENEEVQVNFGQDPFVFDVEAVDLQEREKRRRSLESDMDVLYLL